MTKQNQYYNLMTMVKRDGMIDTNNGQKDYMRDYQEPIQIGTRLWELSNSGYLISVPGKKGNVWVLTQKGMDWEGERLIIKYSSKPKKTKAESEVKQEAKTYKERYLEKHQEIINNNGPLIEKEAPPIQSITRLERRKLGISLFTRG